MSTLGLLAKIAEVVGRHPVPVTQLMLTGLTAQFLIAHSMGGHYDRMIARARKWLRGGEPVAGFGTFHGRVVAERDAEREGAAPDGRAATARTPVVERVRLEQWIDKGGWREVEVTEAADPFRLELSEGRELLVHPGEPQLSGFEEVEMSGQKTPRGFGSLRTVRSAVYPDERVWVTGFLEPAPRAMGAYRGGGEPRKLRPPKGRKLWITRLAPSEGWEKLGRAHRGAGWTALVSLVVAIATAYKPVLGPWAESGTSRMPHLPSHVLLAWLLLAVLSGVSWRIWVVSAQNAWTKRFPWL